MDEIEASSAAMANEIEGALIRWWREDAPCKGATSYAYNSTSGKVAYLFTRGSQVVEITTRSRERIERIERQEHVSWSALPANQRAFIAEAHAAARLYGLSLAWDDARGALLVRSDPNDERFRDPGTKPNLTA